MHQDLPSLPALRTIVSRLPVIFPDGIENRPFLVRRISASTIFVMFYTGAVEGHGNWIRPDQVTKMTDAQASRTALAERRRWARESLVPGKMKDIRGRWYAANTRESIRDETLRSGLVRTGAVIERPGLPTTSAKPRYALASDFASLFQEGVKKRQLILGVKEWQENHLSPEALSRVLLRGRGASAAEASENVLVKLPNGETRQMAPGPSSALSKAVIEDFATRFLADPAVLFMSESGNKTIADDQSLARSLGLVIEADRNLPDIILVDLGPRKALLVFVEVVVTDGPITQARKDSLLAIVRAGGFSESSVAFVSAFEDRSAPAFRRLAGELAWGSMAWFSTEPDRLVLFLEKKIMLDRLP